MTVKYQGATLRCEGKIKESHLVIVHSLLFVSHAEKVETPKGPAILVTFDRDLREDDFKEGLGKAMRAFKFVKKVEPVQAAYFLSDVHKHVTRITDFALNMKPEPASNMTPESTAEYLGRVRSWIRVRNALFDATRELLEPQYKAGGPDGV